MDNVKITRRSYNGYYIYIIREAESIDIYIQRPGNGVIYLCFGVTYDHAAEVDNLIAANINDYIDLYNKIF